MKIYDLTHPIHSNMPLYPGTPQPVIKNIALVKNEGYRESKLSFTSHIGTHIDAPAHMLEEGKTLDQFPISKFTGNAFIINIPSNSKQVNKEFLIQFETDIINADYVLFKTGWCNLWKNEKYFKDFPVLSTGAVKYLVSMDLKGIGMDLPSVDSVSSTTWENHFLFFESELIIIENLNFPVDFKFTKGEISCFPINYVKADGSPVRATFRVK